MSCLGDDFDGMDFVGAFDHLGSEDRHHRTVLVKHAKTFESGPGNFQAPVIFGSGEVGRPTRAAFKALLDE